MRSFVKIMLGASFALGIALCIINFIVAITCFINPLIYLTSLQSKNNNATNQDVIILGIVLLIFALLWLIGVFVSRHVIKMLNEAINKKQLIPSMILLLISLKFISLALIVFTPSKYLISTHPYFE